MPVSWTSTLLDDDMAHIRSRMAGQEVLDYIPQGMKVVYGLGSSPGDYVPANTINGDPLNPEDYETRPTVVYNQFAYRTDDFEYNLSNTRVLEGLVKKMSRELIEKIRAEHPDAILNLSTMEVNNLPPVDDFYSVWRLRVSAWIYKCVAGVDAFAGFEW